MAEPKIEVVKIDTIRADDQNANAGTDRGQKMLQSSLRRYGAGRSILLDQKSRAMAGNKTLKEAAETGIDEVIVVHTTGNQLVAVQRDDMDLDEPEGRGLALADNRVSEVNLVWKESQILDAWQSGQIPDELWTDQELEKWLGESANEEVKDQQIALCIPDALFLSDNEWDVPLLDVTFQADFLELPIVKWGDSARKDKMRGTYHFYTEDYKFEYLWSDPSNLVNSQCMAMVEPNFSTNDQMPMAVGLWSIYRKRWIARYCQSYGIKIFVDLCVDPKFETLNLLGVPFGWLAYSTRALSGSLELVDIDYETACRHAGQKPLFWVYGGGLEVEAHCKANGYLWIPENMHVKDGRHDG